MKNYTDDQLAALIDQSLKATARDVREGRVPLDGRARLPPPETPIGPKEIQGTRRRRVVLTSRSR
jgi:hypothetical protein